MSPTELADALDRLAADAADTIATLTHRAEVAERSCEGAKRREQEASAKMQAMAQSESNKALRVRAEVAEAELRKAREFLKNVSSETAQEAVARADAMERKVQHWRDRCADAAMENDAADEECERLRNENAELRAGPGGHYLAALEQDDPVAWMNEMFDECVRHAKADAEASAALWRERCNKAEARTETLTAELRRLYAAVCHGQTRSDDARAVAQAVIDEYIQTAEQCDRNDTLLERMGESRSLCIEALRGVQATGDVDAQTWDVVADGIRALRAERDALALDKSVILDQLRDAEESEASLRANLARAEGVVQSLNGDIESALTSRRLGLHVPHELDAVPVSALRHIQRQLKAALATYEKSSGNDAR